MITPELRQHCKNVVWLVGDSSLDSKHWLFAGADKHRFDFATAAFAAPAIQGYEVVLSPPRCVKDVAYSVNGELKNRGLEMCCVNAAVEESTLMDRAGGLQPHDAFVRDNLREGDVVIISVGGNDVALRPTPETQFHLGELMTSDMSGWREHGSLEYFIGLFRDKTRDYIQALIAGASTRLVVIICMIYFPNEVPGGSWADSVLETLGYNTMPQRLQALIHLVYERATTQIELPGADVIPVPLFEVLDSKDTADYVQRVEPSVQGGLKMATAFVDAIQRVRQPVAK